MTAQFCILHVKDPECQGATWLDPDVFDNLDEARRYAAEEEMHDVRIVLVTDIEGKE
jgi:hypothetical protein